MPGAAPRLVRLPRHLLHAGLDDLPRLGVPESARHALRALIADLPIVPDASHSALLLGERAVALPCLAVLARHVAQGLRDHNIAIRERAGQLTLRAHRLKLAFLAGDELANLAADSDPRLETEAVLCVHNPRPAVLTLLQRREQAGRATFATVKEVPVALAHWRQVNLAG